MPMALKCLVSGENLKQLKAKSATTQTVLPNRRTREQNCIEFVEIDYISAWGENEAQERESNWAERI